jgi:hypothetical protein
MSYEWHLALIIHNNSKPKHKLIIHNNSTPKHKLIIQHNSRIKYKILNIKKWDYNQTGI